MRTSIKALAASTVLAVSVFAAAAPALADEAAPPSDFTVTGSVAIASQYRFRGVAQSDNKPVVQGALTIAHSSGFYVSTWASSASAGSSPVNIGGTEIDVYGGYTKTLSGITLDGGLYGYIYPGATLGNYYEIYGSVATTVGPATAKVGANYAPAQKVFNINWTSSSRENLYIYGELSGSIPSTPILLHGHIGHTGGGFDYPKQYIDYTVGATVKWKNLALDASLVGTNATRTKFFNSNLGAGSAETTNAYYRTGKPVGVVSLTASF
ncbi:TorF family putative porin [Novosphingobium sp. FKTRR1]|uniref:TorF family putative porin n=1 Tax=Novosphingobium sp. FKTRR1 TaxID=2879118 RepID=UPI001CF0910C|nr:TorF family putative porin [Novosphingobium sp. FKTRR1]